MRAIICTKYGPPEVLQLKEVAKPTPNNNEVLIRVYATTVHRGDTRIRSLNIPGPRWKLLIARLILGIKKPKRAILGMELSGKIEAVGKNVTLFKAGDEVFASTMWSGFGGYAEYKCMPEDGVLAIKPTNMTFEEATVIPSGGITTLGGADKLIDYTKEDFTQNNDEYDVIFDAVDKISSMQAKKALKKTGIYFNVDTSSDNIKTKDVISLLKELKELIEAGKIKAVIDKYYPLEQIVEAHRYVEKGHKKGNVVITISHEDDNNNE